MPDGRIYAVSVFAVEPRDVNSIRIFIQPADAVDSKEVGAVYDYLAEPLPYDKGKLKDRFPDLHAATAWCNTIPTATHRARGCLA
jgi:hypothetical protein